VAGSIVRRNALGLRHLVPAIKPYGRAASPFALSLYFRLIRIGG
jgi:hypothetical protein